MSIPRSAFVAVPVLLLLLGACGPRSEDVPIWNDHLQRWEFVPVEVIDGRAVLGGDVDLGPIERLRTAHEMLRDSAARRNKGLMDPHSTRWPEGKVPYTVDAALAANSATLDSVMRQWEDGTGIRFVPRTDERRYVRLVATPEAGLCTAYMHNQQEPLVIEAEGWCLGHELGHALGLLHEHQRRDRGTYVTVKVPLFFRRGQYVAFRDITPCGPYDLESVMHYVDRRIRARRGYRITRADNVISARDRGAVAATYAGAPCPGSAGG